MKVETINISHGTLDEQRAPIQAVCAAARKARRTVAVMADLPGPRIRLGSLANGALELQTDATFILRPPSDEPGESQQ